MTSPQALTILGAGPAGLAAGYYCSRAGLPFTIYEASTRTGGNAVTFEHHGFRFDSGAHRFHDKDPEITRDVKRLLGADLTPNNAPSHIYDGGKYLNFPICPLNLLLKLGPSAVSRAGLAYIAARLRGTSHDVSFEDFAVHSYGRVVAERFILNYSEKLWGRPACHLSPSVSGNRLSGLNLAALLKEAFMGARTAVRHLDGSFYYPRLGYGMIVNGLAAACGRERIRTRAHISKVFHDGSTVRALEINGEERIDVGDVVCTLPVSLMPQLMEPAPDEALLQMAKRLRFRNLILVVLFLNRERVTASGTVYFPGSEFPFTRVHEPKNRSRDMSPPGKTSLCVEIPCEPEDPNWQRPADALTSDVCAHLRRLGWIEQEDVLDSRVVRLSNAYPVLERGFEENVQAILKYLATFTNLTMTGRNAGFLHGSLHQMLRFGRDAVGRHRGRNDG